MHAKLHVFKPTTCQIFYMVIDFTYLVSLTMKYFKNRRIRYALLWFFSFTFIKSFILSHFFAVMISRTLGLEFGGSIGTLFFFANVVGSAMAISGCTEGIMDNFGPRGHFVSGDSHLPDGDWWRFLTSSMINTLQLLVCLVGAALFAKTSVIILATVTVCLFATYFSFLFVGATNNTVKYFLVLCFHV